MRKFLFGLIPFFFVSNLYAKADVNIPPASILKTSATVTGSWTFKSSTTFSGPITVSGCTGCGGGGGGSGGSVAVATGSDSYFMNFDMAQLHSLTTDFAPIESTSMFKSANSLVPFLVRSLSESATQYAYGKFIVPNNIDLSSNVYFGMNVIPKASSSSGKNVQILFQSTSAYNGDVFNFQISTGMDICPMSASTSGVNMCSWSQSVSNMGWLPGQQVFFKAGRGHDTSKLLGTDLPGSLYGLNLILQIPLISPSGSSGTLTQTQWVQWNAAALTASGTDFAVINATTQASGLLPSAWYRALDAATTVYARTSYYIPENIDMSSTVMVVGVFQSTTAIAGKSIQFIFQSTGTNGGNIGNVVISTGVDGCAVPAVVGQDFVCRFEQSVPGLGWLPGMDTFLQIGRGHDTSKLLANELPGAVFFKTLALGIPVKVTGIGTSFNGGGGAGNLLTTINTWSAPQTANSSWTFVAPISSLTVSGNLIVVASMTAQGVITSTTGFQVWQSTADALGLGDGVAAGPFGSPSLYMMKAGRKTGFYPITSGQWGFMVNGLAVGDMSATTTGAPAVVTSEGTTVLPSYRFGTCTNCGYYMDSSLTQGISSRGTRIFYSDQFGHVILGPTPPANINTVAAVQIVHSVGPDYTSPLVSIGSGPFIVGNGVPLPYMSVGRDTTTINNNLVVSSPSVILSSLTVAVGNSGFGGAISASTYTVNGTRIFGSTWSAFNMDGTVIRITTGSVAPNTSISMSAANLGLSAISWVMCSEIENVNTAGTSVRPKTLNSLPGSFSVYNADVINMKDFSCITIGKP